MMAVGSKPTIIPSDFVPVRGGVLRKYGFSSDYAPRHEVRSDSMPGAVLQPKAVIWGPTTISTCVQKTVVDSIYSSGHGGHPFKRRRWEVIEVLNTETLQEDVNETRRFETIVHTRRSQRDLIFPAKGYKAEFIDYNMDRSLRPGFTYRVRLKIENFLNLLDEIDHAIYVTADPVPIVLPASSSSTQDSLSTAFLQMISTVRLPLECLDPERHPEGREYRSDGKLRISWEQAETPPTGSLLNASVYATNSENMIEVPPGYLTKGRYRFVMSACADVIVIPLINESMFGLSNVSTTTTTTSSSMILVPVEMCGNLTFIITVDPSTPPSLNRRLMASATEDSLALDSPGRCLTASPEMESLVRDLSVSLVGMRYAADISWVAREPVAPLLSVMHNPGESRTFSTDLYRVWGTPLDSNATIVLGAVVVTPASMNASELSKLAWLVPRVKWQISGATIGDQVLQTQPLMDEFVRAATDRKSVV